MKPFYALLQITPPEGVIVAPEKRPDLIIDARAGHHRQLPKLLGRHDARFVRPERRRSYRRRQRADDVVGR